LDVLGAEALQLLAEMPAQKPAEQAGALARWFRSRLELGQGPIDPVKLVRSFGIDVRDVALGAPGIDAVSVWGPRHGPTVLVNSRGRHAQREAGRNSTVAHELCHLLVDRTGALPLAEVFTRSSLPIEARARAFAAEFLIPADVVSNAFQSKEKPRKVLKSLCKNYGVSRELVAWQARNSGVPLSKAAYALLRGQVTSPDVF
jgi:Zn-dependent peptidase ImmA (M78 family)